MTDVVTTVYSLGHWRVDEDSSFDQRDTVRLIPGGGACATLIVTNEFNDGDRIVEARAATCILESHDLLKLLWRTHLAMLKFW